MSVCRQISICNSRGRFGNKVKESMGLLFILTVPLEMKGTFLDTTTDLGGPMSIYEEFSMMTAVSVNAESRWLVWRMRKNLEDTVVV